jgi:hypothetical protein
MPDGDNHKSIAFDVEDDAPVADTQSRAIPAFQPLHVPLPSLRKRLKPCRKPSPYVGRKLEPLPCSCSGPKNLHTLSIAKRDIVVNDIIAHRDTGMTQ